MERDFICLAVSLGGFFALCWFFREHLTEFALASAIVLTPLAHASFVPQELFGLPGVNPVNAIWLFAALCALRGVLALEFQRAAVRFFSWSLLIFGAVYLVAVLRTGLDIESLLPDDPSDRPSAHTLLVFHGIKPIQYVLTGFLVCLYGIRKRTLDAAAKALLVLPLLWICVVIVYYAIGSAGSDADGSLYKAGRAGISAGLGIHANYLGRMSLYLLLFAVSARNLPWRRVFPFSILASVALIELSFSRSAYVAGLILLPLALRKSCWRDRLWVIGSIAIVTLLLYPQLSARVQYGFGSNAQESTVGQADQRFPETKRDRSGGVSAGRIGRIWPLVWPNVVAHPWVGQGLLGVWKPVDRERGLNYDHPHNAYLEVALDSGLVGLVALAFFLRWIWRTSVAFPPMRWVLVGWMLMAITGDTFYPHLQNSLNWIILGMAVAAGAVEINRVPVAREIASRPSNRLKICFVSEGAYPLLADRMGAERVGGAELQQVILGEELVRRGHSVSFVTPDYGQGANARLGVFDVYGSWRPGRGLPGIRFLFPRLVGLCRALGRADADVYCVRTACKELGSVVWFARRNGRRSVFCGARDSDFDPDRLRLRSIPDRWMYFWGLRRCSAIVAQSECQRADLRDQFGRSAIVIPNGYPRPDPPASSGGDQILWVATFRRTKRPYLLLDVAAQLPEMHFAMVGGPSWGNSEDPGLFERVKSKAAKLANVEICGARSLRETEARFDRAAVFVNTSYDEGFPNSFLQAWSRGVPVVSFFDPDGLIRRYDLGVAVEDPAEMVSALRDLAEGRIEFSRAAIRSHFEAHFTIEMLGNRYEEFFTSLGTDES